MPDFASLWGPNRQVAEALFENHSDWMGDRIRYLAGHYDREEAIDIFAEDLEDFVQHLFEEAERKISPVVVASLVEWEPRPSVNLERIAWFFFEEYWPKGSKPKPKPKPKASGNSKPKASSNSRPKKTSAKRPASKQTARGRRRCSHGSPRHPPTPSARYPDATSTWTTC